MVFHGVSVCISLLTNTVECGFTSLLVTWTAFFVKCLFESYAPLFWWFVLVLKEVQGPLVLKEVRVSLHSQHHPRSGAGLFICSLLCLDE